MKFSALENTKEFKNNPFCTATEYPINNNNINISVIELNGKYPEKKKAMNTVCEELSYIIKGSGILHIENKTIKLKKGDAILIEPKEKYYWEGKLTMLVSCTPAWTQDQHKIVE